MASIPLSSKDISRLGREIYDREIRKKVERKHHGTFLAIDIETGDYELGEDMFTAGERLRQRHPGSLSYLMRVGYRAAIKLGPRFKLKRR
jgi:hypothetical protein